MLFATSKIECSADFWQPTIKLERNAHGIQPGFVVELPKAAGEPKLELNQSVFQINKIDYYQIAFSVKPLDSAQWFRLGMGGYQEDRFKHENYDLESDLYLILGYDKPTSSKINITGEVRIFITDLDLGWQIDRASYLSQANNIFFGLSSIWINDKYLDRLAYGPIIGYKDSKYQISLEYFLGDIDWRLEGKYSF